MVVSKLTLEQKVQRALDYREIENLMSRYEFLHAATMQDETVGLFATKTPGIAVEMVWGVWEGPDAPYRCYSGAHKGLQGDRIGQMYMHTLTTSIIEVAEDGKTAQGVWLSPGHETQPDGKGNFIAYWGWCKYACDFVKEDGNWKIWHLKVYGIFHTPYYKSWADLDNPTSTSVQAILPLIPKKFRPDRPVTSPPREYSKKTIYAYDPVPPKPYKTWDDSMSYIPGAGMKSKR